MKLAVSVILAAFVAPAAEAFSSSASSSRVASTSTSSSTALDGISRRNAIQNLAASTTIAIVGGASSFSFAPDAAYADVTNKIASQSSLRYIKRSMKELDKLEFYAAQNDYSEMKQGLRSPALSEIRKNALVLIKGGEDGPEAENLQTAYSTFIKDIETLDGEASLGFR